MSLTQSMQQGSIQSPAVPGAARRSDWFLLGLVGAVALAWLLPEAGARGGPLRPELTSKFGVAVIFFLQGLSLAFGALRQGMLQVRAHVVAQLTTFLAFPLLGLLLYAALARRFGEPLAAGVFYLCALPSTLSSSIALTAAARGNVGTAVFNATLSSLLGVLLTPFWVGLVLKAGGTTLPFNQVVSDLTLWLVLPLFAGQALRPVLGSWAVRHRDKLGVVDRAIILFFVYSSFCEAVEGDVWQANGPAVFGATLLLSTALLGFGLSVSALGCRLLGLSRAERIAAIFCGSTKSLAAGVPMAGLIFGQPASLSLLLLPLMIYHSLQLLVVSLLAARLAAGEASRQPASQG